MTNQNNQDWKEIFRNKCVNSLRMDGNQVIQLTDFIEQTIHQETTKVILDVLEIARKVCYENMEIETDGITIYNRLKIYRDSLQPTNNTKETK